MSSTELTPVTESDNDSLAHSLPLRQRLRKKIATVSWKAFLTTVMINIDNFLLLVSFSLIAAFFPTEATRKNVSLTIIGVIIAAKPLVITILSPLIGYLLPKLRISFSIITGLVMVGGAYIALGLSIYLPSGWPFIIVCIVLRLIEGVGTALFFTASYTLITGLFPGSSGAVIGIVEVGAGLGSSFGPVMGSFLYKAGGYKLPFLTVGGLYLLLAFPMFFILVYARSSQQLTQKPLPFKTIFDLFKNFTMLLLVLGMITVVAGVGFKGTTYALFLENQFCIAAENVGFIFVANTLPYALCSPLAGILADKINPLFIVSSGLLLSGLGYLLIGPSSSLPVKPELWLTILASILTSGGTGILIVATYTAAFKLVLERFPNIAERESERTKMMGIITSILNGGLFFGEFIGPILGGGLTELTNFRTCSSIFGEVFLALMAVLLAVSLINYCFSPKEKRIELKHERGEE